MSAVKPPGDAAGSGRPAGLVDVSNKLAEMISSLQRSREALQSRASGPALTPVPAAAPASAERPAEPARSREEEASLRERFEEVEAANRAVGDELVWLQAQVAHAASTSVMLRRLHEAVDRAEVLDALAEAVVNILGCEHFAVLLSEEERLRPARTMGLGADRAERLAAQLVEPVTTGKLRSGSEARAIDLALTAIVPLSARGRIVGAVAMEALLPQRGALGSLDTEVMELVGLHGALAYLAAPEGARG